MLIKLLLLCYLLINIESSFSKQKLSCPVFGRCSIHKHKICGSDGKLYNSLCHLRKVSCESGGLLKAVHLERCEFTDDSNESIKFKSKNNCKSKDYDHMKEQIINSINDVYLFFSQLDENNDGLVNINELWNGSVFIVPLHNSTCLLTDFLEHEDQNQDDVLDLDEFQKAFNKLYSDTMVTLDKSLSVNTIQAHIGDNVEIRCDILGKLHQPIIKWRRYDIDLSSLKIPNVEVFNDGSLYLTNIQLSLSGNYTCHAENNLVIKQIHILHVIVPPSVQVSPTFQWSIVGQKVTIDCLYQNIESQVKLLWLKNNEPIFFDPRISITHNETRLQIDDVIQNDTGTYTCRLSNFEENVFDQSTSSVIIQNNPVDFSSNFERKTRLLVFHNKGLSVYFKECGLLLFEMSGQDVLPQNGLTLCGTELSSSQSCSWSENAILTKTKIYIGQPLLNRVIIFDSQNFNVIQVIATDPRPTNLWLTQDDGEDQIWILCHEHKETNSHFKKSFDKEKFDETNELKIKWSSSFRARKQHNKKTVQVIKVSQNSHSYNIIHLKPINNHFDLVYNFFAPKSSSLTAVNIRDNNRFAYVTHWDERTLVKVDMKQFKYIKTINLANCQPINGIFTIYGFLIVQCQTPITHQLNGQLVLDQTTDSIISYNAHVKGFKMYLSPNHNFLVNVHHNASSLSPVSTTIIVQRVNQNGLTFLYDVRTTLDIVTCDFVWKNGNYDALLASGNSKREDILYLSLNDGRVELISGIEKPEQGSKRIIAVSQLSQIGAISSLNSIFLVDLNSSKIECEIAHISNTSFLLWTN